MRCLYRGDYGPPDPSFDPGSGGGALLRGFEAHRTDLLQAQNRGQLEAMKRQIQRGESILWCDQGYSWVYEPRVELDLGVLAVAVLLAYALLRVLPWARAASERRRHGTAPGAALAAEPELRRQRQ
jgi:hypothetical protein